MPDTLSPFALQLEKAREVIAALTPRVAATQPFRLCKPSKRIEDEPATSDRLFEVRADSTPAISGTQFVKAQARRSFEVRIRYDAKHHLRDLEARIATDDDQIRGALQDGRNRVEKNAVQQVKLTGGTQDERNGFVVRTLTFEVTYQALP